MDIDVEQAHFVAMLGSCWDDARIAGLPMRLELWDGSSLEGVPIDPAHRHDGDVEELDHTGVAHRLELAGVAVEAADVRMYAAVLPDRHRPAVS